MSDKSPVLSLVFVTGEDQEIEASDLPVLRVYRKGDFWMIIEGEEAIKLALIESLKYLDEASHTLLSMRVEIVTSRNARGETP